MIKRIFHRWKLSLILNSVSMATYLPLPINGTISLIVLMFSETLRKPYCNARASNIVYESCLLVSLLITWTNWLFFHVVYFLYHGYGESFSRPTVLYSCCNVQLTWWLSDQSCRWSNAIVFGWAQGQSANWRPRSSIFPILNAGQYSSINTVLLCSSWSPRRKGMCSTVISMKVGVEQWYQWR